MRIVANDNSNPVKTRSVDAFITVIRDQFPPEFLSTPYNVQIDEYTAIGSFVFDVNATDRDLVVTLNTNFFCYLKAYQNKSSITCCKMFVFLVYTYFPSSDFYYKKLMCRWID